MATNLRDRQAVIAVRSAHHTRETPVEAKRTAAQAFTDAGLTTAVAAQATLKGPQANA